MLKRRENTNFTRSPCTVERVVGCYIYMHNACITLTEPTSLIVSEVKDMLVNLNVM